MVWIFIVNVANRIRNALSTNDKSPEVFTSGLLNGEPGNVLLSLEIQPTIIGAKAFHCPVRNGKEWDHLAMVAWLSLLSLVLYALKTNS